MKRLYIILLTWLFVSPVCAQRKLLKEEFYLGAQGGYMASMVMFNPGVRQVPQRSYLGPTAGLVFRYIGHKVCGFQMEVNYMQRGWHEYLTETDRQYSTGYNRQLDYVEIPMLCHLYFGRKCRGYFELGPQMGYLVHESQRNVPYEYSSAWEDGLPSKTAHQYAHAEKPFDWGLAGGLGLYYRSKYAGTYQLNARFNYSLGGLFSTSQMDYFSTCSQMNLSVTFAYLWQIRPHYKKAKLD